MAAVSEIHVRKSYDHYVLQSIDISKEKFDAYRC